MKAFEEWSKTPNGYAERGSDYAEGEAAWQAALEEVLTQLNNIYNGDFENSDIVKWINKELGKE